MRQPSVRRNKEIADHNPPNRAIVKTGLYVCSGGGGNWLLRLRANGLIVVDSKLPGNYHALIQPVRRISDLAGPGPN